mmetsp:Transcript_21429/g.27712  ORF Transcript_21429/g.27712 Transcript_21429/m.27712 type:complete len:224 (+) Transcript_21429:187-858(+)|eukprot:CAMPEP_0198138218 /NCGR_PEP_ID=MMETSP1443-20131203/1628_1 /TAXON_ID=186043 /ORGANISM="Entomoneis sp., Strain CCMP2396" /LENGTH=223 /DNA_ID=CAMNT_0043799893 /DNA_START=107 /DNA_END=778 /DNA_ORIENTATION=+
MVQVTRLACYFAVWAIIPTLSTAWISSTNAKAFRQSVQVNAAGNIHGENSCFLPLQQVDQDFYAPRIVQIAGAYPGLTKEEFVSVTSEPSPEKGQWTYDFSDPDGPQVGTVALPGGEIVHFAEDPVAIIAEHPSIGVNLPKAIKGAVDLVVVVDRAKRGFADRKFLVVNSPSEGVTIGAYGAKSELPEGGEILGRVLMVQVPWLPSMAPTKTGFAEADEYFNE